MVLDGKSRSPVTSEIIGLGNFGSHGKAAALAQTLPKAARAGLSSRLGTIRVMIDTPSSCCDTLCSLHMCPAFHSLRA